jgi:SAM-dependent methyltransferase
MKVLNIRNCPICGSHDLSEVIVVDKAPKFHVISNETPLNSHLFGKICLAECSTCSHLFNSAIEVDEKNPGHGSFLTNAPVNQSMIDRRRETLEFLSLDERKSRAVLEVGGGSGALSAAFAENGNIVTIVEPESILDIDRLNELGVKVVRDVWPTERLTGEKFDLIICVQVLEHTERPKEFLLELANYIKDDGRIYLEVPSGDWVKMHGSVADVHFPHWNYFSESMIQRLAAECQLNILKRRELINGRDIGYVLQNAAIKTKYSFETPYRKFEIAELYDSIKFAERRINEWNTDCRYAFYGSTAQSQSVYGLFKTCKPKFVFDDTPSYHNAFAYSPEFRFPILNLSLSHLREVDVVVISSYVHDEAISKKLRDVGFIGDIYSLRPPSDPSGKVKSLFSEN